MIDYVDLARRLKGKNVTDDALMPWAYQKANPNGRSQHGDWTIPQLPQAIQPWGKIERMATWYRLALPFKCLEANYEPKWMSWQEGYPEAPEAQFRDAVVPVVWSSKENGYVPVKREVLAYDPVPPTDEKQERYGRFAVWLDGKWRECYTASTKVYKVPFLGKRRLHTNRILKFDLTHGDFGCQMPDASLSLISIP